MINVISFIQSLFNLSQIKDKPVLTLAYHAIKNVDRVKDDIYTVTTRNFIKQMHILKTFFTSISPNELFCHKKYAKPRILITFDDGKKCNFEYAFPILYKMGLEALFFIPTECIGRDGYMTGDEIRFMSSQGMYIGSHSSSHPDFGTITEKKTIHELKKSKKILEKLLYKKIVSFAYPYGNESNIKENDIPLLKKLGYEQAFIFGMDHRYGTGNTYRIPRLMVTDVRGITLLKQIVRMMKSL